MTASTSFTAATTQSIVGSLNSATSSGRTTRPSIPARLPHALRHRRGNMEFDFTAIAAELRYKLLCSFVGPRPIALVTTVSLDGAPNAAPMSFFNVFAQPRRS